MESINSSAPNKSIMHPVALFVVTYVVALAVDIPYLWARMDFHKRFFQGVQGSPLTVRYAPAAIVYLLFAIALIHVAIQPAKSLKAAAAKGAAVGAVMYGFYDATNWATLRGWTTEMAILDTLWGATAGALTASATWWITH
jgi:uncharacterized membrane protein